MQWPFTPDYLDSIPNNIIRLQNQLTDDVIADICRRMRLSGEMTESAIHQIVMLQRQGIDLNDIEKRIAAVNNQSKKEIDDLFERAVGRNREYYDYMITKADIAPPFNAARRLAIQAEAIRRQTLDEFNNITRSMGFAVNVGGKTQFLPIAKAYQQVLDTAMMKVSSGAFDYNTAIKGAADDLARSGLQYIDYASGWHNRIEVAARRAVMTGIGQLTGHYSEMLAEDLGTDIVEITAHGGARPSHAIWQGKLFSLSGESKSYPSLKAGTGYGTGPGLKGWNCRHDFFPFLEGVSERVYTDEQLRNIDPPPFTYQGREYNAYQATQMQRKLETAIRDTKRRMVGYKAAGLEQDDTDTAIRLHRLQGEYRQFSTAAGLKTQQERHRVTGYGQKQAARARFSAKQYVEKYGALRYHKDGTIAVTDDWTAVEHPRIPRTNKPNAVIDTVSQAGKQRDRTIYGSNGKMLRQISNGAHGNLKQHSFGKEGEHAHDIIWKDGKIADRSKRELTEQERKEHSDIL